MFFFHVNMSSLSISIMVVFVMYYYYCKVIKCVEAYIGSMV